MLLLTHDGLVDEREIVEWISDVRSPRLAGREIATLILSEIAEIDAVYLRIAGHLVQKLIMVDGRRQDVALVKPSDGEVVVDWDIVSDVLIWIGQSLRDRSPVASGRYRDGHTLFADDVEVPIGGIIPPADTYKFINLEAYARKIEVGKTSSGRDFVVRVPNKIYERTGKDAQSRFSNIASISVGFEPAGHLLKNDQAKRSFSGRRRISRKQRADRVAGSPISAPVITVKI